MIVYLNGRYIPRQQASIDVDDRGFLFADGVYEVIHSYEGHLFQMDAHLQRMEHGLHSLHIAVDDVQAMREIAERLIAENGLTSGEATVYIQITRGSAPRTHGFPPAGTPPTVYAAAKQYIPQRTQAEEGIAAILVPDTRWARCDIKSVALLPNVLARQRAIEAGVADAVFVRDGVALEGTSSNFFGVFNGEVVTAPKTNYILPGITRQVVIGLCADIGVPVREASILEHQLGEAEELFLTSTIVEIRPIVRLNDRPVGTGTPGPVTRRIQQAFRELVSGLSGG
ncbi:MAG TPA: aminotransferase [Anaerolineae bacterium]|nr:aminotransferase [Anaerolineae bacterium]